MHSHNYLFVLIITAFGIVEASSFIVATGQGFHKCYYVDVATEKVHHKRISDIGSSLWSPEALKTELQVQTRSTLLAELIIQERGRVQS